MTAARIRLIVAVVLFTAWIGWLGWLAFNAANPIVLSRPQFLAADLWVIAKLTGKADHPDQNITIEEVVWPSEKGKDLGAGSSIAVIALEKVGPKQHWQGPGTYILPLTKSGKAGYHLTPIPISPGYPPDGAEIPLRERLLIYPETRRTLEQIESLRRKAAARTLNS